MKPTYSERPKREYVIHWKSKLTGHVGCGSPIELQTAEATVDSMNTKYQDTYHVVRHMSEPSPFKEGA